MERTEIIQQLSEIFSELLEREISLEEGMVANQIEGWDSLLMVTLMVILETTFQCEFALDEMSEITTIGELVDSIQAKQSR